MLSAIYIDSIPVSQLSLGLGCEVIEQHHVATCPSACQDNIHVTIVNVGAHLI